MRRPLSSPTAVRLYATRLALMALIWVGLNGIEVRSWIVGIPAVLAAAWISVQLVPPNPVHWSPRSVITFAGHFFYNSLRGGWDVSRRALSPSLPLHPALLAYSPRLPVGGARWFFCNVISLLPGTAVVSIEKDKILVHTLDATAPVPERLRDLECRVAALFALPLPAKREAGR